MNHLSYKSIIKSAIFSLAILFSFNIQAQTVVDAMDIEKKVKAGEDVTYSNVRIKGILDMTSGREKAGELGSKKIKFSNEVSNKIKGDISFINCTFDDEVYAYYNNKNIDHTPNNSDYTFKYSDFDEDSDFSGNTFEASTTFKYAKFSETTSFANTTFKDDNTFKYTEFKEMVSFQNAVFEEDADFKYTNFDDGVSFENSKFEDDLDFKYTSIDGKFITQNMSVNGRMDTKYFDRRDELPFPTKRR